MHKEPPALPDDVVRTAIGATTLAQRLRAERPQDGTTLSMISALSHLDRGGALTAGRLAELQRSKPQTLTRTLARLEERGWIERATSDEDRRQVVLRLTEAGHERLGRDVHSRAVWLERAMTALSPTERAVLRLAGDLMSSLANWDDVETEDPR